jgi:uncharacterized protein YdhG (YjbR/CyaY superfamily)
MELAEAKTIDEYINSFPEAVQTVLQTLRQTIKEVAPEAQETISYQMPAFTLHGRNLVYFGAWKDHIGFYHASPTIEASIAEVAPYKTGKGTLRFALDQPLPLPLIRQIVEYRVQENLARKKKTKKAK